MYLQRKRGSSVNGKRWHSKETKFSYYPLSVFKVLIYKVLSHSPHCYHSPFCATMCNPISQSTYIIAESIIVLAGSLQGDISDPISMSQYMAVYVCLSVCLLQLQFDSELKSYLDKTFLVSVSLLKTDSGHKLTIHF